ncbi:MAG: hypothetical protein J6A89_03985 [Clostridia bacterium]|nr:hypothetical protein [Clostridia bacterium]
MSLAEMKELIKILIANVFIATVIIVGLAYIFALITYKKAHKNVKKSHKATSKNVKVVFDIGDTNKMNFFEIKQAKENIERCLKGAM